MIFMRFEIKIHLVYREPKDNQTEYVKIKFPIKVKSLMVYFEEQYGAINACPDAYQELHFENNTIKEINCAVKCILRFEEKYKTVLREDQINALLDYAMLQHTTNNSHTSIRRFNYALNHPIDHYGKYLYLGVPSSFNKYHLESEGIYVEKGIVNKCK